MSWKFKVELAGLPIKKFCELKPKLYFVLLANVQKNCLQKESKHCPRQIEPWDVQRGIKKLRSSESGKRQFPHRQTPITSCMCQQIFAERIKRQKIYQLGPKNYATIRTLFVEEWVNYETKMCVEIDWDMELNEPFKLFELPEGGKASIWEILEPGFLELSYSNEELRDVGDLSSLSDHSDNSGHGISNLLICNEAV